MGVVIVSRQVGSYGDEIAALTAQKLNYQIVGREKAHELAESCDPDFKDACQLYERETPKSFWERFFLNNIAYASLFESLNYDIAAKGDVVILGRGSPDRTVRNPRHFQGKSGGSDGNTGGESQQRTGYDHGSGRRLCP